MRHDILKFPKLKTYAESKYYRPNNAIEQFSLTIIIFNLQYADRASCTQVRLFSIEKNSVTVLACDKTCAALDSNLCPSLPFMSLQNAVAFNLFSNLYFNVIIAFYGI